MNLPLSLAILALALAVALAVAFRIRGSIVAADRYREVQEELRLAERRYRALVEQAPVLVYEWEFGDPGRWRYISPQIESLLGYPAETFEADPRAWYDHIHEDDRDAALADEASSQAAGTGQAVEYRMIHRDGHVVWVRDEAIAVRDEPGSPYFRGIVADITAQKEAELALASMNADLERRVEARTEQLERANEDLARAKDVAVKASQAKSEFLSRASHELRTPLNAILGFGQLLELSTSTDGDRDHVGEILKAGRRLLRLIDDILDLNKVQAGTLSLSLESVSVPEVVGHAIGSVRARADAAGVRVEITGTEEDLVLADRQRLLRVLTEILTNGIAFNRPGGLVSIDWSSSDGRTSIHVSDTGAGISGDELEELFTVFHRAGGPRTAEDDGTGLGLPISRALIEAMGGTIQAQSEVGTGTTLTLELASATASTTTGAEPLWTDQGDGEGRDRTILVVDDNPANVTLMQEIVGNQPRITMLRAMLGEVGLQLAKEHDPDLVLLDFHLPDMTGEEALGRLRRDPATRHIPVIVVSAGADHAQIRRLEEMGIDGFVSKPIDLSRLLDVVRAVLSRAEVPPASVPGPVT